jgi:hypothetical protein
MLEQVAYRFRGDSFRCVKATALGLANCGIVIGWKSYAGNGDTVASDLRVDNRQYPWREIFPPDPKIFLFVPALRRVLLGFEAADRRQLMWDFRH